MGDRGRGLWPGTPGTGETATATATTGSDAETTTSSASTGAPTPTTGAADPTTGGAVTSEGGEDTSTPGCGEALIAVEVVKPGVMLVLDKSSSMVADPDGLWDHDGDDADDDGVQDTDPRAMATARVTRWRSLHEVVTATATLFERSMNLGLVLFPSLQATADFDDDACPVEPAPDVEIAPMNAAAIVGVLPPADDTTLAGATPATRGVEVALAGLAEAPSDAPMHLIFVTDGAANCAAGPGVELFEDIDAALEPAVLDAFMRRGVVTHVVGVAVRDEVTPVAEDGVPDGVNLHARLDALAEAGGAPLPGATRFHDAQDRAGLVAAFASIVESSVRCTLELPAVPGNLDGVRIFVGDVQYPEISDCAAGDGWQFVDDLFKTIVLCGQACDDMRVQGEVDAQFRCPE